MEIQTSSFHWQLFLFEEGCAIQSSAPLYQVNLVVKVWTPVSELKKKFSVSLPFYFPLFTMIIWSIWIAIEWWFRSVLTVLYSNPAQVRLHQHWVAARWGRRSPCWCQIPGQPEERRGLPPLQLMHLQQHKEERVSNKCKTYLWTWTHNL